MVPKRHDGKALCESSFTLPLALTPLPLRASPFMLA